MAMGVFCQAINYNCGINNNVQNIYSMLIRK